MGRQGSSEGSCGARHYREMMAKTGLVSFDIIVNKLSCPFPSVVDAFSYA
jgi:hypothetical protein